MKFDDVTTEYDWEVQVCKVSVALFKFFRTSLFENSSQTCGKIYVHIAPIIAIHAILSHQIILLVKLNNSMSIHSIYFLYNK